MSYVSCPQFTKALISRLMSVSRLKDFLGRISEHPQNNVHVKQYLRDHKVFYQNDEYRKV